MIRERIARLSDADRALVLGSVTSPLKSALDAFAAGSIGERELIAIEMAVNGQLTQFPHMKAFCADTDKALRDRLAEMDAAP